MLTLQFISYADIEDLGTDARIAKILKVVKDDKIAVMEGRLRKEEESALIKATMEAIDDRFKGIEISVVYPSSSSGTFGKKLKGGLTRILLGERQGLTVVGPAHIIKEIKKDPDKIQLFTAEKKRKRRK
jgi:hypothetical protein